MIITFKGTSMTLNGKPLQAEDTMPDFILMDQSLRAVRACGLNGVRVFLSLPSLSDYAVFMMNIEGKITYAEYVLEVSAYPDYEAVLSHLHTLS